MQYNGIISENAIKKKSSIIDCPRCQLVNALENKYCSKCSYPLKPEAYDEIKENEDKRIKILEQKYENTIETIREEMDQRFNNILSLISANPKLVNVKTDILEKII